MLPGAKPLPGNAGLVGRLTNTIPHMDAAAEALGGGRDDDGAARSLFNDLQYLRARMLDRLREEKAKLTAHQTEKKT